MSLSFVPSIDLIMGPMMCGKSTELIRRLNVYNELSMRVLYINSAKDTRGDKMFSTHNLTLNSIPFDGIKISDLTEIDEKTLEKYDVIGIDEAQFFPSLKECVIAFAEKHGKIVIVSGLNGDFNRNPFGHILDLIPFCDNITKLSSFCLSCKKDGNVKPAIFTKRLVNDENCIIIGGKETYNPTCRKCFAKSFFSS